MGFIERRNGPYRDPLGRQLSETFTRKLDAERFLREVQVGIERGRWLDPQGAELTLAAWSEEFLSMARRLAPTTQQTYRRDMQKYILSRFGAYRIGRLPADEIEKWLMDEIDAGYRMGHSSINVTLDRYGHLFPELDEAIASSFETEIAAQRAARAGNVVQGTFAG